MTERTQHADPHAHGHHPVDHHRVAGIWLAVAPLLTSYRPTGAVWITATTNHVATGTVLAVIILAAALTINGGALRALDGTVDAVATTVDPGHVGS